MKGLWVWPSEPKEQSKVLRKVREDAHLSAILLALALFKDGLSNTKLNDIALNNSQWVTYRHLGELLALGFIEYRIHIYGDAGLYRLTELGKATLPSIAL